MSFCDFDMLSACGSLESLEGFPGQEDVGLPACSLSPSVDSNLRLLESIRRDRTRNATLEASRTAASSTDRYPFESDAGEEPIASPYELSVANVAKVSKDSEMADLSRESEDSVAGPGSEDSLSSLSFLRSFSGPHAACPPTRPPTPLSFFDPVPPTSPMLSDSTPSLCPSSPSTCALDSDEFRRIFPPRPAPRFLDGDELLARFPSHADSTGNPLAVAHYIPPARRTGWQRTRFESELRERQNRERRERKTDASSGPTPRVFYSTVTPGVFDTVLQSEQRPVELIAGRIAANCLAIAMSPNELAVQISNLDDLALQTIERLTDLLRCGTPERHDSDPVVRILQCAIHATYGLDFKCLTAGGSVVWCRDIDLRMTSSAQQLVNEYLSDPRRTFSQEQIRKLRALPQYWHEEGRHIFVPMMRRALPESVRAPRAYV
ncbi:hypothetical protein AURDEDRAFT_162257 [Auricularia subglabra TFB-10046 SS5]|nr:hypothetical protein AURDEDRAFT_162257 [Auricularia subglabra TFB-10046 SS5]